MKAAADPFHLLVLATVLAAAASNTGSRRFSFSPRASRRSGFSGSDDGRDGDDNRREGGAGLSSRRRRPAFFLPSTASSSTSSATSYQLLPRGGGDVAAPPSVESPAAADEAATPTPDATAEPVEGDGESLDDRVEAAMRRLGLEQPDADDGDAAAEEGDGVECADGVCYPKSDSTADSDIESNASNDDAVVEDAVVEDAVVEDEDVFALAERIASETGVPRDIALAAIGASTNEEMARAFVKAEMDAVEGVPEDCDEVQQLVAEGYETYFARRALAFTDTNVDNARAILIADKEDEEAEQREREAYEAQQQQLQEEAEAEEAAYIAANKAEEEKANRLLGGTSSSTVVQSNFDPAASSAKSAAAKAAKPKAKQPDTPPPAKKEDVVFELESITDLQRLVIESPVPVLLDVYAEWCGPCKQLTPALEQIVVNAGGMLRLVKVDTDQLRQVSTALGVKSLPTVFGMRDGRIRHMFEGMPRDENAIRNFLMGVMMPGGENTFDPPLTVEQKDLYADLTQKLVKLSCSASFSFAGRELLQERIRKGLDDLVVAIGAGETGMAVAEDSAKILKSLMANVIKDPFDTKFRRIKLDNKVVAKKIAQYAPCMTILKSVGFVADGDSALVVGAGKKVVNVAPLNVGRDAIDKWIDKNRYEISAAARKRKDEIERVRIAAEEAAAALLREDEESESEEEEEESHTNEATIHVRVEGKNKVHTVVLDKDDTLGGLVDRLPLEVEEGASVQLTCVARRLVVKSSDAEAMAKTLLELGLVPTATIVAKIIGESKEGEDGSGAGVVRGGLAERAAAAQKKKTGSHSMHSIGLYAKNDNNKHELIDGGGGVMYEQGSDEEDEGEEDEAGEEGGDDDDGEEVADDGDIAKDADDASEE